MRKDACGTARRDGAVYEEVVRELQEADVGRVALGEPLSLYTTWKIGGPADVWVEPKDVAALQRVLAIVRAHGVPWTVIGRGSNLLVRDGGIRGVVLKLDKGFDYAHFEGDRVRAGAAFSVIRLAVLAGKEGLTGLEFAGGIPGSVGGAVYMNAGAHGSDISRVLKEATVLFPDGTLRTLTNRELAFRYRTSRLQEEPGIVLEATFQLAPGDRKEIARVMAEYKDRRRRTQPLQQPCAGSVFRNPPGDHAGRLIEAAGLKGYRIGDAQISPIHANFIVNLGQASARDVLALIEHAQETVDKRFGVALEPEVLIIGEPAPRV